MYQFHSAGLERSNRTHNIVACGKAAAVRETFRVQTIPLSGLSRAGRGARREYIIVRIVLTMKMNENHDTLCMYMSGAYMFSSNIRGLGRRVGGIAQRFLGVRARMHF